VTEFVKLGLVKASCLPLLTYSVGTLDLTVTCIRELTVSWNDSFRTGVVLEFAFLAASGAIILAGGHGPIWLQKARVCEVTPLLLRPTEMKISV